MKHVVIDEKIVNTMSLQRKVDQLEGFLKAADLISRHPDKIEEIKASATITRDELTCKEIGFHPRV